MNRYQDLALKNKRIYRASKKTMKPIMIGALRTISKNAKTYRGKLDLHDIIQSAQLSVIFGIAHILRKVLVVAETKIRRPSRTLNRVSTANNSASLRPF